MQYQCAPGDFATIQQTVQKDPSCDSLPSSLCTLRLDEAPILSASCFRTLKAPDLAIWRRRRFASLMHIPSLSRLPVESVRRTNELHQQPAATVVISADGGDERRKLAGSRQPLRRSRIISMTYSAYRGLLVPPTARPAHH